MRRFLATVLFGLGSLVSVNAFAGDADFTLANGTGLTIDEVYVTSAKRNSWGKDILGEGDLPNGKSRLIRFSDKANCRQDIKVVFEAGGDAIWENVDLCEINKITIKYNRATKEVSATSE